MQTGTKISVAIHAGLVGWALVGGTFRSDPLPFEVQEVSVISVQEFEALSARPATPEVSPDPVGLPQPETPETPEIAPPEIIPREDVAPQVTPPEVVEPPQISDTPPVPVEPVQEPDVSDSAASLVTPPVPQVEPQAPVVAVRPRTRPAERVAPTPVVPPPPDAAPDPVERPEVAAEEGAEIEQEVQEATAPEAASDRIETEANQADETEQAALAPTRSPRPPASRPARAQAPSSPPADEVDTADAIAAAVAAAQAAGQQNAETQAEVPSGPPLSAGEKDGLRVAVSNCWNVGSLSSEALRTTVVVGVSMSQDGKPDVGSIQMLSSSGGSAASAKQAFEAARRAIIRCGARGYDLPAEKYAHWRDIEMTFNPERMRIK
ncbi:MAG: energy transducer TonB [Rhodobacteraceae bacterium]|nr:energy transducer TonB [Paracoccaceae bacterium]